MTRVFWAMLVCVTATVGCDDPPPKGDGEGPRRRVGDGGVRHRGDADINTIMDCAEGDTRPCGSRIGECRQGTERCIQELWTGQCEEEVGPTDEVCDLLDNDCDENVDEMFNIGGDCKVRDERQIEQNGVIACDPETGMPLCRLETECNPDNDADGFNACEDCDDDDPHNFPGNPERCDHRDNNCNGFIDEHYDLGAACVIGQGECRGGGITECAPNELEVICVGESGDQNVEICDGLDNDCDTLIDEDYQLNAPCEVGAGACAEPGRLVCAAEGGTRCDGEPGDPGIETCNGVDDDCDGSEDEGFGVGDICGEGVGGCRREAEIECTPDGDPICPVMAGEPMPEICNFIDDDCNGIVDDNFDVLTDINNCGACGNICPLPGPECIDGACFRTFWINEQTGSDANGDGSVADPWRTISHGADTVPPADPVANVPRARIYVAPGRYAVDQHPEEPEVFPIRMRDTVQLVGAGETPDEVVIDGGSIGDARARPGGGELLAVVDMADEQNLVANLMVLNGGANPRFSALRVSTSADNLMTPTLVEFKDVWIREARANSAYPAMVIYDSEVYLDAVVVEDSVGSGSRGLILSSYGTVVFDGVTFQRNDVGEPGGFGLVHVSAGEATFLNPVVINNEGNGLQFRDLAEGVVYHGTFAGNTGAGIAVLEGASTIIANSVFANNGAYGLLVNAEAVADTEVINNLFHENVSGLLTDLRNRRIGDLDTLNDLDTASANYIGDPVFYNRVSGNVRLREGSQCVDMADPNHVVGHDFDGNPRPRGDRADVGAFESFHEP